MCIVVGSLNARNMVYPVSVSGLIQSLCMVELIK